MLLSPLHEVEPIANSTFRNGFGNKLKITRQAVHFMERYPRQRFAQRVSKRKKIKLRNKRQEKLPSAVNSADSAGFNLIKGTSDFNNNQMGRIHYAKMD